MMYFNYHQKEDQMFNDIVDAVVQSVEMRATGKYDVAKYDEIQKNLNANIAKYITQGTSFESRFEEKGSEILKNPNVVKNKVVQSRFNEVLVEIMTTVVPKVTSAAFTNAFMEVRQVGWGDTATFRVTSNDLFKVNEIAEGVRRSALQPIYNDEITVNPTNTEIATSIDWYAVASGRFDWGDFGYRAGKSFQAYIMLKGVVAMASATKALGAGYTASGFTTKQWSTLQERVSAANGGAAVYGLGTLTALNQIIPENAGLQYGLGEEVAKEGFLDKYLGAKLVPLDQSMVPGTVNSSAVLTLPDNVVYLIAADQYRPVKVVFEGDNVVVEMNEKETTDKTYVVSIQMRIGVAAIVGSKFGQITLEG